MIRFRTLVVMAIFMIVAMSVSATDVKVWKEVGLNPTTTSLNETLKDMSLTYGDREFVRTNFPDTVNIQDMIFAQGSEGPGKVFSPVYTEYSQPTKALVWRTGRVNIYMILGCNNVAWSPACPDVVEEIIPEVVAPIESGTSEWFVGMPAWFQSLIWIALAILIFLLLLWIAIRLTQNVRQPAPPPIPPTTPVHPEPEPVPEESLGLVEQLGQKTTALKANQLEGDMLRSDIEHLKTAVNDEVTAADEVLKS